MSELCSFTLEKPRWIKFRSTYFFAIIILDEFFKFFAIALQDSKQFQLPLAVNLDPK